MSHAVSRRRTVPDGWKAILAESEAELAAGQVLSGDGVIRELQDSIARLDLWAARTQIHPVIKQGINCA